MKLIWNVSGEKKTKKNEKKRCGRGTHRKKKRQRNEPLPSVIAKSASASVAKSIAAQKKQDNDNPAAVTIISASVAAASPAVISAQSEKNDDPQNTAAVAAEA